MSNSTEQSKFYIDIESVEDFEKVTKGSSVCVVDFHASWCGPCKMLAPKLEKTIKEHSILSQMTTSNINDEDLQSKLTFVKIDVDSNEDLAKIFQVSSIPMIVFYNKGKLQTEKVLGADLNGIMKVVNKLALPTEE